MPKKRGQAEEALSSPEQKLRLLVETIPALVSRVGAEGNVEFTAQLQAILNLLPTYTWYSAPSGGLTFVNKRTAEYLGVPNDHPLRLGIDVGAQWDDWVPLLHPDDQEEARKYWSNLLRTGEGGEHSSRVRSAQEDYRWFLTRIEPLRASDGTLLLWIGATLDIEELKCAEEALRQSEYKLRQIFETVPSHLWSANPAFEPTSLNQHLLEYFGRGFEDFQHGGWEAFLHPDDLPETAEALSHAVQTGTYFQVMHRLRRADGEFRWHHARGAPLRDRQGNIIQWYGLSVDIDEAKKSEDRLRRSGAYLAEAQRLSHTGSFGWTPSTGELHWSNETFRILEYDPSMKPTVEHVLQRIHPDERAMVRRLIEETSGGENDLDVTHRLLMPNGSVKFVHVLSHAMKDVAGNLEIVGALMDVTENTFLYRDLAEREARLVEQTKALRRSEAYLADSQRLSHTGTAVFNATTGQHVYWSEENYRIWALDSLQGLPSHEAVRQRIYPEDRDGVWQKVQEALREREDYSGEFRIVLPNGTVRYLTTNGHHLFSTNGELVEVIATSVDVTDHKRAEERLRVQHTVAQILAEAATIEEAAPKILLAMGECLGWDVGVLWRVDREVEALRCVELWHKASIHVPEFERASREFTFGPGLGLPGRVWSSREPEYIPDVVPDENFPRAPIAEREGLRSAFGFPILLGTEVLGVIEFFSREIRQPDQLLLNVLATIGSQIGQFIERKHGEEALRGSEAKIRRLVDANIIGIFIWDLDGRIIEANDAFLRLVGYDHEDIVSGRLRWAELTPPEWFVTHEGRLAGLKATGSLWPYEKEYFRKDGSRVPVLTGGATFEEGGSQGVAFVLDLTERKRADQALRESEAKFRDYAETASDWFWETGPDYKFTLLTENAFGSDSSNRIGTACWDNALDLTTEPEKWRLVRETLDSRQSFRDFVYCTLGGNGSPMYVRASGKPMFDADGQFRGYRGTGTDVTKQEQLTQELHRREVYLAEAQRLSQTGSWAWGPDQVIRYWSEECYRVLSFDPQAGLPQFEELFQRIHPDDQPGFRELKDRVIREKAGWEADYRIVHLDGRVRDIHVVGHPVLNTSGHVVEFVGTVIDVTERRRAEQERARLRQLEADLAHINRVSTLGEMAASLSHEITQPIASARNNARAAQNFLDMRPPDLSEVREALSCVVGDTDRAGDIVDRIRDHIKKTPPRREHFDLNDAINEVIALGRSAIIKNGVSVQTRFSEGLSSIHGDRVQLQQVVLNLILNAAEAMGSVEAAPRDLLISTEQYHTGVLVAVRDSGPGIDPDHLDRVFEAFYTTKSRGVGMGLSICRSIIDAHGGRLWAEANKPRGTIFQFTLPAAQVGS